jgi:hypothetical protein
MDDKKLDDARIAEAARKAAGLPPKPEAKPKPTPEETAAEAARRAAGLDNLKI